MGEIEMTGLGDSWAIALPLVVTNRKIENPIPSIDKTASACFCWVV
jgi:hypothetical protein